MRGRPDVDLKIPPVVHPGEEVDIEMVADSRSDTPIDFIDLAFEGEETLSLVIDGDQRSRVRSIVHVGTRLRDEGVLTEGKHRFRARFRVPSDAPASYSGVRITIRYEVRLHVSIPWWPDLKEIYEVLVERHPGARPKPKGVTATSASGGEPFIELSLTDTAFAPGDEVSGAFSAGNLPQRETDGVEISLVGVEHVSVEGVVRGGEQFRFIVPTVFPAPKRGAVVPFRFRVPKDVVPSFTSPWCELTWEVQAVLRASWSRAVACAIPVTIGRHNLPREASGARPDIGFARWRRVWSEAGDRYGLSLSDDDLVLEGSRGEVEIAVSFSEDSDGPTLIAALRYPSLELELSVEPQFLIVLPNEVETLLDGYRVKCREIAQARALFGVELRGALGVFRTMRADDRRMVVRSTGSGHGQPELHEFLARVMQLAGALAEAIQQVPPPAAMRDALPAWRLFAAATGARLAPGGMVLAEANVDGAAFDVTTTFGNDAIITGTRIDLELDPPLNFRVSMDDPASFSAAPPGSRDFAVALQGSVESLRIRPQTITVEVAGPAEDPSDLRPTMVEMLMLARRLRGERTPGPYR